MSESAPGPVPHTKAQSFDKMNKAATGDARQAVKGAAKGAAQSYGVLAVQAGKAIRPNQPRKPSGLWPDKYTEVALTPVVAIIYAVLGFGRLPVEPEPPKKDHALLFGFLFIAAVAGGRKARERPKS